MEGITIRYENIRQAFFRGEEVKLAFKVLTPPEKTVEGAILSVDIAGLIKHKAQLAKIEPAASASCLVSVDTRLLKAGEYTVRCELEAGNRSLAKAEFPFWVARRWNPDRMRVWLWPHNRFGVHVKKLDDMARKQFAWYDNIGVNAFQPHGELNKDKLEVFDYGLVKGWEMGVSISGAVKDKFDGLSPEARYEIRRKKIINDPFHPEVARKQNEKNREIMEIVRQFPGVKLSFFNSEIVDAMAGIEPPMSKQYRAEHTGPTVKHEFILPGVIPDNDERYVRHLYDLKGGDGLAVANERAARMVHRFNPDHVLFTDPHRIGAVYDKFPGMGVISTWTYTNPDPRYMLFIETLIATGKPTGQGVLHTVTLLNYPGTIFPKDKGWSVMGPARLVETNWINLSRRPDGISIYLSSDCDPFDTVTGDPVYDKVARAPYQRYAPTFEAFKEFTEKVVQPYGPMIRRLARTPRRAAVLSSESSRLYANSPGWAAYYDNYAIYDFYILLNMIHIPADVVFDETIVRYGLDGYDVLFLPRCETLTKSVYDKIVAFQKRGGLLISDQYLRAPIPGVLKFDFDFAYRKKVSANAILESKDYAHWDDLIDVDKVKTVEVKGVTAEVDQKLMERHAAQLEKGLEGKIQRNVACSSPTALLNMLEKGATKYLFIINDKRTYGDRVGQYKAMLDKALPQTVTITLNEWPHEELYVYDMLERKPLAQKKQGDACTFDVDLPAPGGKIIALLPQRLGSVRIHVPKEIRVRGVPVKIHVIVTDANGRPMTGVQPLQVTITDPQGNTSEFSDYHAAENGTLALDFVPALNDRAGTWSVIATELTSGLKARATFEIAK